MSAEIYEEYQVDTSKSCLGFRLSWRLRLWPSGSMQAKIVGSRRSAESVQLFAGSREGPMFGMAGSKRMDTLASDTLSINFTHK